MVHLSVLSYIAAVIYLYTGLKAFTSNRKSKLCRLFFYINFSMAIWSFAGGFLYLAENQYEYSLWNKIAAFGWCTFASLVLYLSLVLTGNRSIRHWYIRFLVMLPAPTFLFMVLFLFGPDIDTHPLIETIFYTGNFLYNLTYLAISILLIFLWGYKSNRKIEKKQANIVVICSLIPYLLNLLVEKILPSLGWIRLPNMGQIFTLIMLWGVNYAIIKYQFMSISSTLVTKNLFNELTGLTILTDPKGYIIKVNKYACRLFDYSQDEMIGRQITTIFKDKDFCNTIEGSEDVHEIQRFHDINVSIVSGPTIPFNISVTPIYIKPEFLQGYLIIGEDIRTNKSLQDVIIKHKITIEKLRNSEVLFRTLLEVTPVAIVLISKDLGQIRYLNKRAEELLVAEKETLIGMHVTDFFVNPEDEDFYVSQKEEINNNVHTTETLFRRRDGSQFNGLITIDYAVYNEEEVIFACVIDMTEQKRTEAILKQNNEKIIKLNDELMIMNNILANKSVKDGLTNLYNHQYMNEILEIKLKDIDSDENLCIMMLDIDHFKQVNDKYGHQIGDQVLVKVSRLIMDNTRLGDSVGRYGGEEFIVILPDTEIEKASEIAENIRKNIEEYDFLMGELQITISLGVVQYSGEISHTLINKADMLLYKAKNNGRNRVEKD